MKNNFLKTFFLLVATPLLLLASEPTAADIKSELKALLEKDAYEVGDVSIIKQISEGKIVEIEYEAMIRSLKTRRLIKGDIAKALGSYDGKNTIMQIVRMQRDQVNPMRGIIRFKKMGKRYTFLNFK